MVSVALRRDRLSRAEGLELIKLHDGKYPWTYLGKPLDQILGRIGLTIDEFDAICERFTNKKLFLKGANGTLMRDSSNSLIKVNYEKLKG